MGKAVPFSPSRRNFLRGDVSGTRASVTRPPWALEEFSFHQACTRCNACVSACEDKIIRTDAAGFPYIDFSIGGCTFCEQCVQHCETGALKKHPAASPWQFQIAIQHECLATRQIVCRTCGERCEADAIRFIPARGGVSVPQLNVSACTGCGSCIADCPAQAIKLSPVFSEAA